MRAARQVHLPSSQARAPRGARSMQGPLYNIRQEVKAYTLDTGKVNNTGACPRCASADCSQKACGTVAASSLH